MTTQNTKRQIKFQYQDLQCLLTLSQHKHSFYGHKETKILQETLYKVVVAVHQELILFATITAKKGSLPEIATFIRIKGVFVIDAAILKQIAEPKINKRLILSLKSHFYSRVIVKQ